MRPLEVALPTGYPLAIVPVRDISRREALQRLGAAGLVLGGAAALGRAVWDKGHPGLAASGDGALTRDFRIPRGAAELPQLAVARGGPGSGPPGGPDLDAASLVRKAVEALGGMRRFVSRGDVVVVKPNIGWDRMPIPAANTNPDVGGPAIQQDFDAGA